MQSVNLRKYQVVTVSDALAVVEENSDPVSTIERFHNHASSVLERQLPLSSGGGRALLLSQKGKRDTLVFTLGVSLFLSLFIVLLLLQFLLDCSTQMSAF
jgi:hypothetical protein